MALSKVVSVQEMTSFIQSGMTYDQTRTIVTVFILYTLYTHLSIKNESLYISLFQGRQMI